MSAPELWWQDSRKAIHDAFGEDADMFGRILAATSPLSTIETNVAVAIRAYRGVHWFDELPREGLIEVHYVGVKNILNGGTVGRKVWSLYQNFAGNEEVCPIDRWMLRYFGYDIRTRVDNKLYDELEYKIKCDAWLMGVTPAVRQCQMWCESRGDSTSYGDIIVKRELNKDNLLRRLL